MEELFEYLRQIYELLEQIDTITDNQTTVLLAPVEETTKQEDDSEEESLDMIAQMADYKDELMGKLSKLESMFQEQYDRCKQFLNDDQDVKRLKEFVAAILERKEAIVEHEQNNILLLQAHSKKRLEKVSIPQNPKNVSNAYKKQQEKVDTKKIK